VTQSRLAVVGASGRIGRRVVELAPEHGFTDVRPVARGEIQNLSSGDVDAIVDFSSPEATTELARVVARTGTALVSGTTGLGPEERIALDVASKSAAVFWEPNMSFGAHVLVDIVRRAAMLLGPEFDVEISETHHRMKVDAPSGTAKRLIEAIADVRGASAGSVIFGRQGRTGPRPVKEIAVHALRGGDEIGNHTTYFLGLGEQISLTHRATSRDVFARGALRAARFLGGKAPGRYGMSDL
jgi:4-hydroxy-tetrahydrodipicolinate reductase